MAALRWLGVVVVAMPNKDYDARIDASSLALHTTSVPDPDARIAPNSPGLQAPRTSNRL